MVLLQGPLPACSAYRHDGSRRHVNVNDEQRGKRPTELASEPLQSSSRVWQTYVCSSAILSNDGGTHSFLNATSSVSDDILSTLDGIGFKYSDIFLSIFQIF